MVQGRPERSRERKVAHNMLRELDTDIENCNIEVDRLVEANEDEYLLEKVMALKEMILISKYKRDALLELLARSLDYTEEEEDQ